MDTTAPESLIEHFSKLEDPRVDRNKKHELIDVIVLCVCAVVSGAEGWSDIAAKIVINKSSHRHQ